MTLHYFTFSVMYGDEPRHTRHPAGGHADGYFTIEASDANEARAAMNVICDRQWAFQYPNPPSLDFFPRGELKRFDAADVLRGMGARP